MVDFNMPAINWIVISSWAVGFFVIAFIYFLVYWFLIRSPIEVNVLAQRGAGSIRLKKLGRIVKNGGNKELHFGWGEKTQLTDENFLYLNGSMLAFFRKYVCYLRRDGQGEYHFCTYNPLKNQVDVEEQDAKFWFMHSVEDSKNLWEEEQGIWSKYGQHIMAIGSMMIFFVLMLILLQKIDSVAMSLDHVASAMSTIGLPGAHP